MLLTEREDTSSWFDGFTRDVSEPFWNNVNTHNSLYTINPAQKQTFKWKEHRDNCVSLGELLTEKIAWELLLSG